MRGYAWAMVAGATIAASCFASTSGAPTGGIDLPFGFHLMPEISLGQIGFGVAILVQMGRWGRHAAGQLAAYADHVAKVPELEKKLEEVPTLKRRMDRVEDRLGLPEIEGVVQDWYTRN